jgi:hypothetical protein
MQFNCWGRDNWCHSRYMSIWPYTCKYVNFPVNVRFVALKLRQMSAHFALALILWRAYKDSSSALLLLQHNIALQSWILWDSESALTNRCRVHKPSISARYELAAGDLSQKVPVNCSPVLLQNISQPTPLKSAAFFQSYDPSVTHTSVFDFMPSTSHVRSRFIGWASSIPSHVHVPPHVSKKLQKSVGELVPLANGSPLLSLLMLLLEN